MRKLFATVFVVFVLVAVAAFAAASWGTLTGGPSASWGTLANPNASWGT